MKHGAMEGIQAEQAEWNMMLQEMGSWRVGFYFWSFLLAQTGSLGLGKMTPGKETKLEKTSRVRKKRGTYNSVYSCCKG